MDSYLNLLKRIVDEGTFKEKTRGQPTIYRFNESLQVDLAPGPPIITTREVRFQNLIVELLWLISGANSIEPMQEVGVNFWSPWADENGHVESYGRFWRHLPFSYVHQYTPDQSQKENGMVVSQNQGKPFLDAPRSGTLDQKDAPFLRHDERFGWGFDQLEHVIWKLKNEPYSRRIKLDQWIPQNALASSLPPCPCHLLFDVAPPGEGEEDPKLNLHVWQRSADVPVGVVYNLGVYGMFAILLAREVGMRPGEIAFSFTNAHIYEDQIPQVMRQVKREPLPRSEMIVHADKPMLEWEVSDYEKFVLLNYDHKEAINYPVQD